MFNQSENDSEHAEAMQNHSAQHGGVAGEAAAAHEPQVMPLTPATPETSWMRTNNNNTEMNDYGGGCSAARATRRLRIAWALVVVIFLVGISFFGSSDTSMTGRSVYKNDFDVNAPPGKEEKVYPKQVIAPGRIKELLRLDEGNFNASELPFPVIEADDDIPVSSVVVEEKAVDALECRESVINFVINATDAKDECNGLKKAFDMTCNSDSSNDIKASADPEAKHPQSNNARRLFEKKSNTNKKRISVTLRLYQATRSLRDFAKRHLLPSNDDELFFPEDEITGDAWEEAKYQVMNDYDAEIHESTRRRLVAELEPRYSVVRMRFLEEATTNETKEEDANATAAVNETKMSKPPVKKVVSLSMPTNKQHASNDMLTDTIMLGKENEIQEAIKVSSNKTNVTLTAAQEDAVASAKAVHDTAAAVSAVLNDPESVEARTCCASILNVYHEHCDKTDSHELSDSNLFIIVFIIAFCGVVKSLIRHFKIRWLPEAAGCILVGVLFGGVMSFFPHYDLSFDGDWFLRIMVPPIVFEAALSIDKKSFQKHIVPILVYAVIGTLFATGVTAFIVHKGTALLGCETIPYVESLTFGALISSIDPIAVLSVLSNMGMTDTDAIYVVIFGESLLNDGIAMVLFETLVHFMDTSLVIDREAFLLATMHFLVVALGSIMVGLISGMACTWYFYAMKGCQTPLVEVLVFFCWAFVPYYICDGVEWSGIVSIVISGIVMDLYVVGQTPSTEEGGLPSITADTPSVDSVSQKRWDRDTLGRRIFSKKGHLSAVARTHTGFVTEILSTMMETAIFSYLGFFLFSYRYHWNFWHVTVALLACCVSRAVMIPTLSLLANWITSMQQARHNCRAAVQLRRSGSNVDTGVTIGSRMQLVLWFAGLRGAMSFALVENIPLYDAVTGEGSRMKAELKAMTSACIIFTVFVMGGCTDYVIERLGMGGGKKMAASDVELTSLLSRANGRILDSKGSGEEASEEIPPNGSPKSTKFRQRSRT